MATRPKKKQTGRAGRVAFGVLVATAVLALAFFLVLRTQNQTSIAENAIGTILSPIQSAFSGVTIFIRDTVNGVKDYFRMSEELAETKQQVTDLKIQLMEYREAAIENENLKTLLDAKERFAPTEAVYARVIARVPGIWFDTFSINVGTNQGVQVHMAVITGDGLVGMVYEVGLNYAKVRTIIDPNSAVGCLIQSTRRQGVMYGRANLDSEVVECQMKYIPALNDVSPGDVVITSGEDKLYPKGIKVGTVTKVSREQSDTAAPYIMVEPSVDFQRIELVLVLLTVVETDGQPLEPLPTRTPAPTPIETPAPSPTPNTDVPTGLDEIFQYPQGQLTDDGELIEIPTQAPSGQGPSGVPPEEEWAG